MASAWWADLGSDNDVITGADNKAKKLRYIVDTADMVLPLRKGPPMALTDGTLVPTADEAGIMLAELRAAVDELSASRWMRFCSPANKPHLASPPL